MPTFNEADRTLSPQVSISSALAFFFPASKNQKPGRRSRSPPVSPPRRNRMELPNGGFFVLGLLLLFGVLADPAAAIRFPEWIPESGRRQPTQSLMVAFFALGSFWRSEAAFGCLPGVVRTSVGYAGGTKTNPKYPNLWDHAECVKVEYDPKVIQFKQLLDVFWANHDPRQVFGQGPDVGNQYRSIIFTNGTLEARLAAASKEREQTKSRSSIVTTQIQQIGPFYPAEFGHQKFELKRNHFLVQLIGNMPEEELMTSSLAAKLNGYAAELCPPGIQKKIDAKIDEILKNGWPILREIKEALV